MRMFTWDGSKPQSAWLRPTFRTTTSEYNCVVDEIEPGEQPMSLPSTKRNNNSHNTHDLSHNQIPLTPTYQNPRLAPHPPTVKPASFRSLQSVFNRRKAPSIISNRSEASFTSAQSHPYAQMNMAPMPVVSNHAGVEDEEDCPVCLEPLSFSFRLPGEKPHIVPECGHALHEACFTAVYGPPPNQSRSTVPRKTNLGVCGVCRRPMKVGDGDGGKSNSKSSLLLCIPSHLQQNLQLSQEWVTQMPRLSIQAEIPLLLVNELSLQPKNLSTLTKTTLSITQIPSSLAHQSIQTNTSLLPQFRSAQSSAHSPEQVIKVNHSLA